MSRRMELMLASVSSRSAPGAFHLSKRRAARVCLRLSSAGCRIAEGVCDGCDGAVAVVGAGLVGVCAARATGGQRVVRRRAEGRSRVKIALIGISCDLPGCKRKLVGWLRASGGRPKGGAERTCAALDLEPIATICES